jgi:hypothetical protein
MNLDEVFLSSLVNPNEEKALVLYERSKGNGFQHNWSSSNPFHRAPLVDLHTIHLNISDEEKDDAADPRAVFSRNSAHLRRSWVTKGLEILLGVKDHTLYRDPRDPEDISGRQ